MITGEHGGINQFIHRLDAEYGIKVDKSMRDANSVQIHEGTLHSAYQVADLALREDAVCRPPLFVLLPEGERDVLVFQLNVEEVAIKGQGI